MQACVLLLLVAGVRSAGCLAFQNAARLQGGDARAVAIVDALCEVMGRALFNVTALFDVQRIALGGSVFWHNQDYLLPRLRAFMVGKLPALTEGLALVPAGLGERVGDYAALALVAR